MHLSVYVNKNNVFLSVYFVCVQINTAETATAAAAVATVTPVTAAAAVATATPVRRARSPGAVVDKHLYHRMHFQSNFNDV